MRRLSKVILSFFMVASLSSLTACDVIGGFLGKPDDGGNSGTEQPDVTPPVTEPVISAVSLVLNGGVSDPLTEYQEGTKEIGRAHV